MTDEVGALQAQQLRPAAAGASLFSAPASRRKAYHHSRLAQAAQEEAAAAHFLDVEAEAEDDDDREDELQSEVCLAPCLASMCSAPLC